MHAVDNICRILEAEYGKPEWPGPRPVLDELVLTILSQNTTAKNCFEAFRSLSERFPGWDEVRVADAAVIADAIRCGGLANRKAPRIKRILEHIYKQQGNLDLDWLAATSESEAIEYMLGFDGVGRKTAACVLMFGLGLPVMPVDTHVHRVATRLGLIEKMSADAAHDALQAVVPPEQVFACHVNLVTHGRRVCQARGPDCGRCVLKTECEYFAKQSRVDG